MPAIDPNRLARQVEGLIALPDEPVKIARVVRDLVEEYSGHSKSSVPSVPRPVIRSLRGALQQHAQPMAIGEALWKESLPDTQLLAAGMLERIEDPKWRPLLNVGRARMYRSKSFANWAHAA